MLDRGSPTLPIPKRLQDREALKLAQFLRAVDASLGAPCFAIVYGASAVSLYLGDQTDRPYINATKDIDIDQSSNLVLPVKVIRNDFEINKSNVENWMVSSSWRERCVNFSRLLELEQLQIGCVHPHDLILLKLLRWNERDAVDAFDLAVRYVNEWKYLEEDFEDALMYIVLDEFKKENLKYKFQELQENFEFALSSIPTITPKEHA